jgi:hypothetical protein
MTEAIECQIDGTVVNVPNVAVFRQRNPFPGEHSYRLLLRGTHLRKVFREQSNGRIEPPIDDKTSSLILFSVDAVLKRLKGPGCTEKYVLNTIVAAEFTDETVTIEGVCSEIVDFQVA